MKNNTCILKIRSCSILICLTIFLSGIYFSSCGPSAEEQKKMQQQAAATFDSLTKEADKKLKENLRKIDSTRNANLTPVSNGNK